MTDLFAARAQMAMSLAFHILFAVVGMAMPLLMVIAERLHQRRGDAVYRELAERWSKGTAIMFAVGAVSGTVLSFELGLLWPHFMAFAGPIIGMPFSLEGFAFFLEAIFLGIFLYGRDRVPPLAHLLAGVMVLASGTASAVFVLCANAWMNTPTGYTLGAGGEVVDVDPFAAMWNPASLSEVLHMTSAAFAAVGFAVAGIHAAMLLRGGRRELHRPALRIALTVGAVFALLQPITGDLAAKHVAEHQPIKLAAMEAHFDSERGAPFRIFGWPDEQAEETRYAIEVPYVLSFLAHGDPHAEVKGLKEFPREQRPPVAVVHVAFQIMVGCGLVMIAVASLGAAFAARRRALPDWYLRLLVVSAPLGVIAIEAGWTVTEVGRQPWVIQGVLRTADAVTPMPHLVVPFAAFTALYVVLGVTVLVLLRRVVFAAEVPAHVPVGMSSETSREVAR
ncbi:cytochrome ubiquinol oxidase subunit I [Nannocystis pusilla]|uniref:Cytochrome ubiquinol oxidase subunit I n=1 Tax=Nannocystis pusilla TaxID=889268 RepID=A0ABS7U4M7_9BACT|nr:cytochrome ubiquinol oxidase subunit I [Nannocystis pusilla]MBZ5715499.1 cytochrome ubiquinol oxidase subunit I [Nannocystis pusilla]